MFEIMNKEKNIVIGPRNKSIKEFYSLFQNDYPKLLKNNVIVDMSDTKIGKTSDVLLFLKTAQAHVQKGTSFVLIACNVNIDELPEELNVAPTMIEALDIIEMEEIGRDMGF